jgi:G3E family GTPase
MIIPVRTATHVVIGATGAGKTTHIARMLAQRPPGERWAVVVNDFGKTALDEAPGVREGDVVLREVTGCACCTSQVALRVALVDLLRRARPHRLLIEASSAAEPEALLKVLREPGIAQAIDLQPTITLRP